VVGIVMDDLDKLLRTVRFLTASSKKLSDSFQESDSKLRCKIAHIAGDIEELEQRLADLEAQLVGIRDQALSIHRQRLPELPVVETTADRVIPAINLTIETILDVYAGAPILLEPFSRPCALTAKTLNGETATIELEVSSQALTWVLEANELGWLLMPRLGILERAHQLRSLQRLFEIRGGDCLPAQLQLLRPALLDSIVLGQKWQLVELGILDVKPDPTKVSFTERLSKI
jgi:hypothetical protein